MPSGVVSLERLEHEPRERADRRRRAEQSGMRGDAAERRGVLVVHFADEQAAAPRIDLRRRDARRHAAGGRNCSRAPATIASQRVELRVERRAPMRLENEAEQHEAGIGVDRGRAGRALERQRADRRLDTRRDRCVLPQSRVRRQSDE